MAEAADRAGAVGGAKALVQGSGRARVSQAASNMRCMVRGRICGHRAEVRSCIAGFIHLLGLRVCFPRSRTEKSLCLGLDGPNDDPEGSWSVQCPIFGVFCPSEWSKHSARCGFCPPDAHFATFKVVWAARAMQNGFKVGAPLVEFLSKVTLNHLGVPVGVFWAHFGAILTAFMSQNPFTWSRFGTPQK